ncbi:hypothetical protein N7478_009293 [Penicillium angulare]|uniref:uncharacterized protein n=1 Tax=Penicillium angulare TaxID=116970 RepID=UPI00254002AD|nr:uncharacterized protein N7478_009293 [Penicillium angulare]KAJ5266485.1 hypothetical protein N7478_009293 [Penicillium angulare]
MGLSNSAIIVIVLVAALAAVTTAAGIFSVIDPERDSFKSPSIEQHQYMRTVRHRYFELLQSYADKHDAWRQKPSSAHEGTADMV